MSGGSVSSRPFWPSQRHAEKGDDVGRVIRSLGPMLAAWDKPRPTAECRHCHGTGMADESNECGFCE